jgi:hypothetical protein
MFRRKKSTTPSCQPQQTDLLRTIFNFGLPQPHLVAQGAASFAGPEALLPVPKTLPEAKLRIISTCANPARNSRKINTSILKNLNVPRINTYRKSFRASEKSGFAAKAKFLLPQSGFACTADIPEGLTLAL